MNNIEWWDKWYTGLEKGLTKYTRPVNWQDRAINAESNCRKPVRNQYEGRRSKHNEND